MRNAPCNISYRKHTSETVLKTISKEYPISSAEAEFGTLAFFILQSNRDQFKSLSDLMNHSNGSSIKIPRWFFDFDLDFDPQTKLLTKLVFYLYQKKIAEYEYQMTGIQK